MQMAERAGFEPARRFCRLRDFQSRSFDLSDTSPLILKIAGGRPEGRPWLGGRSRSWPFSCGGLCRVVLGRDAELS
jgi:hypothetical protein